MGGGHSHRRWHDSRKDAEARGYVEVWVRVRGRHGPKSWLLHGLMMRWDWSSGNYGLPVTLRRITIPSSCDLCVDLSEVRQAKL